MYYRKGLACFELNEFEIAKRAFEIGCELRRAKKKDVIAYTRSIRKCDAELAGKSLIIYSHIFYLSFPLLFLLPFKLIVLLFCCFCF